MPSIAQDTPLVPAAVADEARKRNAVKGAILSEYIDMYDIYLPIVVMSPILFYFQPADLRPGLAAILASLVFVTTLLGRPVGSLLFGIMADRTGRRAATIASVAGFGLITLLIGLLPGHETIGIASYWLLVALRFLDGICLGGGYTGSIPLAFESAERSKRGLVGSLIMTGFPLAYVTITLVAMLMFALFPLAGPGSPYVVWGWRIPFIMGAALAGVLALYYVTSVPESEVWASRAAGASRARAPLAGLVRGAGGRTMLQVIVMMTGFWLTQNLITIYVPTTLLAQTLRLSKFELTSTLLVTYSLLIASYIASGLVAQRIGRRRFFIVMGPIISVIGSALLYVLITVRLPLLAVSGLVCLLGVLVTSPWGVIITYINERFVTDVRATGFGVGFGLSVIIPSFYAFYMNWLGILMPFELTPVLLLFVGGLLGALGAWMGPETNGVEF